MPRFMVVAPIAALALTLGACSQQTPATPVSPGSASAVQAPIVVEAGDLQGTTQDMTVGQVLDINTGDLAVDSYSADIEDPTIAEFVEGRDSGGATFNPGITALSVGSTQVTLSNEDGGIEDVVFTVTVTEPGNRD